MKCPGAHWAPARVSAQRAASAASWPTVRRDGTGPRPVRHVL